MKLRLKAVRKDESYLLIDLKDEVLEITSYDEKGDPSDIDIKEYSETLSKVRKVNKMERKVQVLGTNIKTRESLLREARMFFKEGEINGVKFYFSKI